MRKGGGDGGKQEAGAGFIDQALCGDRGEQEAAGSMDHHGTAGASMV